MRRLALALALLASALAVSAEAAPGWRVYANPRYGTILEVPGDWRPGREPDNGDGLVFTSPDGAASIRVWGGLHIADSIAEELDSRETAEPGETVSYRRRGPRSLVISGRRGDTVFYRKSILSCRDTVWNSVVIEYPAARKAALDPLVARVAGSLKQGRGFQAESCR
jgi:serine/threonine-protein kinase